MAVKTLSDYAAAAKAIRIELKKAFPGVIFHVHYKGYSMGDHVNISWDDGPTDKSVEALTKKYQMGNVDSRQDIYEYDNCRSDIPQSKYVFTNRRMSDKVEVILSKRLAEYWGVDMNDEKAVKSRTSWTPRELIYREFLKTSF